jgi:hypothetical protein
MIDWKLVALIVDLSALSLRIMRHIRLLSSFDIERHQTKRTLTLVVKNENSLCGEHRA